MQADPGRNYFELFGLPVAYELDLAELGQRYRDLQRRFHPDRFASATDAERRLSVQMTAQINAAYQTLRDAVARGRYLLGLAGVETGEDTDTRMDPGFLMEQMELRESLDEVRAAGDRESRLADLRERVDAMFAARHGELGRHFTAGTDQTRLAARNTIREMQFLQKLLQEIEELE